MTRNMNRKRERESTNALENSTHTCVACARKSPENVGAAVVACLRCFLLVCAHAIVPDY